MQAWLPNGVIFLDTFDTVPQISKGHGKDYV